MAQANQPQVPGYSVVIDNSGAPPPPPPEPPVPEPLTSVPVESAPPPAVESSYIPQMPPQETVVMGPQGAVPLAAGQGVPLEGMSPQETVSVPPPPPPPPPSGGLLKRIVMILVFLLILLGIVFAVRFVMGLSKGTSEVTISYWGLWENEAIVRPVIESFQTEHPKIKVDYVKQLPQQYRERLQAAIDRGEGPDVFRFHNTWVSMLYKQLATVPTTVMTASEFGSTFYPVAGSDLVAGETIYGIPLMIDGLALYVNEDMLAAAGVSTPSTWEDVLTMVPQLTVKTDSGIVTSAIALGTTANVEHFSDILATMFMQNGANLAKPTGQEAEEAIVFYRKFADPSDPVYTWNETLDNSIYAFASGRVAMILAPSWRAFDIKQISPDLNFKITPMPQLPGHTVTWASYWVEGVSAKGKNLEASWEFIKYLTGSDAATKLYAEASKNRLFGEPYARMELSGSLSQDPFVGAYISQAASARSFPLASRTFDDGLNTKLIKYLEDAVNTLSSGNSATSALETMHSGFSQVLSTYGLSAASPQTAQ